MTIWESLTCDACNEEMKEEEGIKIGRETVYKCPKCGIKVRFSWEED